jgi:hypothetical protein
MSTIDTSNEHLPQQVDAEQAWGNRPSLMEVCNELAGDRFQALRLRRPVDGPSAGRLCRRLVGADHGSWYFAVQVPTIGGRRARHRRGGFSSPEAALAAGQAVVESGPVDMASQAWTVSRRLQFWLGTVEVRPSTVNSYRQHVHRYLIPVLGRLRLDELTVRRLQACFDLLARRHNGHR